MSAYNLLSERAFPEFARGSVWLASVGKGDPHQLSPLARRALDAADAVIHDPGISSVILNLVTPPRYREAAAPDQAIARSIKLAEDGWRVVYLIEGSVLERASEAGARFSEKGIPSQAVLNPDEAQTASIALMFARRSLFNGTADSGALATLVIPFSFVMTTGSPDRQLPTNFSMSGLAG